MFKKIWTYYKQYFKKRTLYKNAHSQENLLRLGFGEISLLDYENPSDIQIIQSLDLNPSNYKLLKNKDKKTTLKVLNRVPECLEFVDHPDEDIAFTVLKRNGIYLKFLKHKSHQCCQIAIQSNGLALQYIKNPTELDCLKAISQNAEAIKYVKSPTEKFYLQAMDVNFTCIEFIPSPTREMCLIAVKCSNKGIAYIPKEMQDDEMKWISLRLHKGNLEFINNPTEEMVIFCLDEYPQFIKYITPTLGTSLKCMNHPLAQELVVYQNILIVPNPSHAETLDNLYKKIDISQKMKESFNDSN
jgi:hypothetical protein